LAAVGFLAQYLMTFGILAMQVETVFANVDTEKRHRIHERSSAENEKSPASVNLQGFSVRLTISLSPHVCGLIPTRQVLMGQNAVTPPSTASE
jgi:hypothetical protein